MTLKPFEARCFYRELVELSGLQANKTKTLQKIKTQNSLGCFPGLHKVVLRFCHNSNSKHCN